MWNDLIMFLKMCLIDIQVNKSTFKLFLLTKVLGNSLIESQLAREITTVL